MMTLLWFADMALLGTATLYMWVAEFEKSPSEVSSVLGILNRWFIFSAALSWLSTTGVGCYYSYFRNRGSRDGSLWVVWVSMLGLVWLSFAVALSESALLVARDVGNIDDGRRAGTALVLCANALAVRLFQTSLGHSVTEHTKNEHSYDTSDCLNS